MEETDNNFFIAVTASRKGKILNFQMTNYTITIRTSQTKPDQGNNVSLSFSKHV